MDLVLIRHGEAENGTLDSEDSKRNLTADGRKELMDAMPNLKRFFKSYEDIRIWSSPLLRASQSAQIIARALKIEKTKTYDFISNGDFTALSAELSRFKDISGIVIVGHEPYLSDWSLKICGFYLPFQKGASACFKLNSVNPPAGNLKWLLNIKTLKRLGEE